MSDSVVLVTYTSQGMTRRRCTDIWARVRRLFDSHTYHITPYGAVHGVIGINHRAYVGQTPYEPNCVLQRLIDSEEGEEEVDSAAGVFFFEDSDVALC
jgi:hypothetical protein